MTRRRRLAIASVLALAVAALALVLVPGAVPEGLLGPVAGGSSGWVLRAIGVVLLLIAGGRFLLGVLAGAGSSEESSPMASAPRDHDRPPGNTHGVVGERLDTQLDALASHRDTARADVLRDELRPLAIELVRRIEDLDRETARRRVERGEWTDDPRASAFFATEPVAIPLRIRILDRLADEPRCYRQAVHAIDAMAAYRSELGVPLDRSAAGEPERPTADPEVDGDPSEATRADSEVDPEFSGATRADSGVERGSSKATRADSAGGSDGSSLRSGSSNGAGVDPEGDRP